MGPPEVAGPPKHLLGDLGAGADRLQGPPRDQLQENGVEGMLANQIGVPEREKAPAWIDQKWYKDKDRMGMLLAAASNGFGNMTLRGNSGLKGTNDMLMKVGMQGMEDNKTMKYLAENNPEMFRVMTKLPPNQRGEYMKLAMQSKFRKATGADDTAAIRNYEYFEGLSDDEQKAFLGVQRGDKIIKGTDGSVQVRRADGSLETVISSEDAIAGTYSSTSASDVASSDSEKIQTLSQNAKDSARQIPLLQEELAMSLDPSRAEGLLAPIEKMFNALRAELGDEYNTDLTGATRDQLLKAGSARRVMNWFKQSGLGARGMDTPAEYNRLLEAFGGLESMTPQAYSELLRRLIRDKERTIEDYNSELGSGRYDDVFNSEFYQPRDMPWRNDANTPAPPPGAVLDL
jgi:hypothetical protein